MVGFLSALLLLTIYIGYNLNTITIEDLAVMTVIFIAVPLFKRNKSYLLTTLIWNLFLFISNVALAYMFNSEYTLNEISMPIFRQLWGASMNFYITVIMIFTTIVELLYQDKLKKDGVTDGVEYEKSHGFVRLTFMSSIIGIIVSCAFNNLGTYKMNNTICVLLSLVAFITYLYGSHHIKKDKVEETSVKE